MPKRAHGFTSPASAASACVTFYVYHRTLLPNYQHWYDRNLKKPPPLFKRTASPQAVGNELRRDSDSKACSWSKPKIPEAVIDKTSNFEVEV
jgi:hypothetical protein